MRLVDNLHCSGCSACVAACRKGALRMKADAEGFLRPSLDETKCVDCGLCAKACPALHPREKGEVRGVWAAKSVADAARCESSSGGIFPLLAKSILDEGGVVFGARWTEALSVIHDCAEDEEGVKAFYSSKYA